MEATLPPAQRLLHDPYAEGFLRGVRAQAVAGWRRMPPRLRLTAARLLDRSLAGAYSFVMARHRAIDEQLQAFDGEQVVLLGAGYDSRRARLRESLEGKRVFEVDHPATAASKAERSPAAFAGAELAPAEEVQVDFVHESFADVLVARGLEPGEPTAWVWEGVSMYLPEAEVLSCLQRIAGLSGPGSWVVFDALCDSGGLEGLTVKLASGVLGLVGEPFLWVPTPTELAALVVRAGLDVAEVSPAVDLVGRFQPSRVRGGPFDCGMYLVDARSRA